MHTSGSGDRELTHNRACLSYAVRFGGPTSSGAATPPRGGHPAFIAFPCTIELRREREISRWRLHLVKHRSTLKNRVHSTLITFGHQRHMSDLFGVAGRRLLKELEMPEPWRSHVDASLVLIDDLEARITQIAKELRRSGADHRYIPVLMTAPGVRVDHLVHGRVRDRRHHPVLITGQADRLHPGCARGSNSPGRPTSAARSPNTGPSICAGG